MGLVMPKRFHYGKVLGWREGGVSGQCSLVTRKEDKGLSVGGGAALSEVPIPKGGAHWNSCPRGFPGNLQGGFGRTWAGWGGGVEMIGVHREGGKRKKKNPSIGGGPFVIRGGGSRTLTRGGVHIREQRRGKTT